MIFLHILCLLAYFYQFQSVLFWSMLVYINLFLINLVYFWTVCFSVKQEKTDQKKADEKTRREAIFQNYLQRKAEEDGSEDDVRPASHSKRQNAAKPKTPRPKSQPPPATGGNLNEDSRSYNTPGSVGSQLTDPRTASPASDLSKSQCLIHVARFRIRQSRQLPGVLQYSGAIFTQQNLFCICMFFKHFPMRIFLWKSKFALYCKMAMI